MRSVPWIVFFSSLTFAALFFFTKYAFDDVHVTYGVNSYQSSNLNQGNRNRLYAEKRSSYPARINMGECPPLFGNVIIFVAYVKQSMETHYKVAQESLSCYLKGTNYTVKMIDLDNDSRVKKECGKNQQLFFKKHCAAAAYLRDSDWMLVLDADTGVVNPNHCIEEWIDDRVDIIFYERFFNWEIASGNYLIRNTKFSSDFLKKWSDWEFTQPSNWNGADNGVLQMHILQTIMPHAKQEIENCDFYWHNSTGYDSYMAYVTCCKMALGANRLWPGKIRIYKRAHGWVRDGFLTTDRFCDDDFMFHGWKSNIVGDKGWESPFEKNINTVLCGNGMDGWNHRSKKKVSCEIIRQALFNFERSSGQNFPKVARVIPYLALPDVGNCFPNCEKDV